MTKARGQPPAPPPPSMEERKRFFDTIYQSAGEDASHVPWADLKPKDRLANWLSGNPGDGRTAIDVACGLGDNAEALAAAGYKTVAFDLAQSAVDWAKRRFAGSTVEYVAANLLDLPAQWIQAFDLVHECYTIQSVDPSLHERFSRAVSSLVKPGGHLLIYARTRPQGAAASGPPWPLQPSETAAFALWGFEPVSREQFDVVRPDRAIANEFSVWRKRADWTGS